MSRNPEYQFVSTDTSPIISNLAAVWEKMTGRTLPPASPDKLFIHWVANAMIQERALLNYTGNQNIPSRSSDSDLDALGELFHDSTRPDAQPAVCTERFTISEARSTAILIPAGTKVTDASGVLVWSTTSDEYVAIGDLYADVAIQCQTEGIIGNGYAIGQINRLIDVDNIALFKSCENITVSDKGADRASDEEYYNLMRSSQDAYSAAGPMGGYIYFAKSVSTEITDVVPNSPSAGTVAIYALMRDGTIASEEIKNAILAACNPSDVRPLTDLVTVGDPELVSYNIDLTFYIPSNSQRSSTEIEAAVQAAVSDYVGWQCARLGRDINPDELRQRVKETGIKRMELRSPAFTALSDGRGVPTAPQVAAVGIITIVAGGHEDE